MHKKPTTDIYLYARIFLGCHGGGLGGLFLGFAVGVEGAAIHIIGEPEGLAQALVLLLVGLRQLVGFLRSETQPGRYLFIEGSYNLKRDDC